jgi:uncharacterized membrane protein YeaQ/YmgE (transglycosylase-associated protein family)
MARHVLKIKPQRLPIGVLWPGKIIMSFILWIVFGLIVGFIASNVVGSGGGLLTDIILGVIGAVIGGWLFQERTGRGHRGHRCTPHLSTDSKSLSRTLATGEKTVFGAPGQATPPRGPLHTSD